MRLLRPGDSVPAQLVSGTLYSEIQNVLPGAQSEQAVANLTRASSINPAARALYLNLAASALKEGNFASFSNLCQQIVRHASGQ
jgi:hypothetical protein